MPIELNVPESLRRDIENAAAGQGLSVADFLIGLAQSDNVSPRLPKIALSYDQWREAADSFQQYLKTILNLQIAKTVDDSRASIYEGCGE